MRKCYNISFFSILINGSMATLFHSSRGLRQGALFSFLCLLIAEALGWLVNSDFERSLIKGFEMEEGGQLRTHLQFNNFLQRFAKTIKDG